MKTDRLMELYEKYNIAKLSFGTIHDKLGDVYEQFCVKVLETNKFLEMAKSKVVSEEIEYNIFLGLFAVNGIEDFSNIKHIGGSDPIPARLSHGLSKTDVIAHITYNNGTEKNIPISCKQSTVSKVAFAEFDVDTICSEIGISDSRLKSLMVKHQKDASAKNFKLNEKAELKELIAPISRKFVRWVVTGSPDCECCDLKFPTAIIKFELTKPKDRHNINIEKGDFDLKSYKIFTIDQYIDTIMLDGKGAVKNGGFGTGLSWTYATGSKGQKIQFKG